MDDILIGLGSALTGFVANIGMGFGVALSWQNILLCLMGCLLGTMIGVLPGIGPLTTMAMVLPFTFWLSPVGTLIMLFDVLFGTYQQPRAGGPAAVGVEHDPVPSGFWNQVISPFRRAER